jgi:8-oxo-dGTP diphosphatase
MGFDRYSIPNVGLALVVRNQGQVMMHVRRNSHDSNTWAFPGGHLELYEEPEEGALRELKEEAGEDISVFNVRKWTFTHDVFPGYQRHYITLFMIADYYSGQAKNMEPDKGGDWEWHPWNFLPRPLMTPIVNLLKGGYDPFAR